MKPFPYLLILLSSLFLLELTPASAQNNNQQCVYTVTKSGSFAATGSEKIFSLTSGANGCSATPTSGSNAKIVIPSGFDVVFDQNYNVGKGGSIEIASGSTLRGNSVLSLGDGTGSQSDTYLTIRSGAFVQVDQLVINKALVNIDPSTPRQPRSLVTNCNLVLLNTAILDDGVILVNGNLDLTTGGANISLCGKGGVAVVGCVYGGNGATNRLISNCAGSLGTPTVCAKASPTPGCPGPISGNNANETSCDPLVVGTTQCFVSVLPVELVRFTATPTDRSVALRWTTATEKNNAGFAVERSADGISYRTIQSLPGAGTTQSTTNYEATDEQPLPGISYYRLRQTDFDGKSTYSSPVAVSRETGSAASLEVYPEHGQQTWVVKSNLPAELLSARAPEVRVFDALGRVQNVKATADANTLGRWTVNMAAMPAGMYVIRVVSAGGVQSTRILK